ncbi:MAG: pilus assembly PilX N-terminal domain-containing protein [Phycisphaerae bacterium]|nr:pilus assembly PilX N-terminal domain-containing protein [Phycisphaerae bacterium]
MRPKRKSSRRERAGAILIISMIFVVVFSALAVCMATMSGNNVQLASNHQNLNAALVAAQSGQEVLRYLFSRVLISSSTPQNQYFSEIITAVRDDLTNNGISGIGVATDGAIAAVTLDSTTGRSFDGQILFDANQPTVMEVRVTGHGGQASRTITTSFDIEPYEFPIFKYGLATKGPLDFPGNPTITAVNTAWEADIFVESSGNPIAVQVIGNTNFDGEINIGNTAANVDFVGAVQIAGDTGQAAIDNHVAIGMDSPEFPAPDVNRFLQYAIGDVVDSSTDLSHGITLTNATIEAGTNPVFDGTVTIQGVLFIESPNKVTFGRNVALQGIIVADGDVDNPDPGTNSIDILGNFASQPYPSGIEFDAIRQEEGTSILAPGFHATFAGNFSTLEGVVAVSGAHFSGNMNAQIKGTIINYSDSSTVVEGNASMNFDRADSVKVPAGFDLYRELNYVPASYSEAGI